MTALALALVLAAATPAAAPAAPKPAPRIELRTAAGHPMKYWLGRPAGTTPGQRLPILVVITDARREFAAAAGEFLAAEDAIAGGPRFLVVVPATLNSGGTAQNVKQAYPYDAAAWARAARYGNCAFDDDGIAAVLADVRRTAPADTGRACLTGLEAAGHVVFAQAFRHPERWRAVIAVAPNWQGRCMDAAAWSADASRARLPILIVHGDRDSLWASSPLPAQAAQAASAARAHGFLGVEDRAIPARGHDFLPDAVLALLPGPRVR
jgi:poly(3-hydroxybutyrate) depolymerase